MIARKLTFIAAALMCIASVSCKKDTTIQYNNLTMGNITEGTFVSDQGNIFNVTDQAATITKNLFDMKRAYILCDVLNKTAGGSDNEYDIRLNALAEVLAKDVITLGSEVEEEKLVEDPIYIDQVWFSGGYLNLYIIFAMKKDSQTKHQVNLVQQESTEGYLFKLTHNAYGEKLDEESVWGGGYISFPINAVIAEDSAKVKIEWTWYKQSGTSLSQETEPKYIQGTYTKGSFDNAPKTIKAETRAAIE